MAIQSDSSVLVGGSFASYDGTSGGRIARLTSSGGLDTVFVTSGTGFNSTVQDIVVLSDGRLLVGGSFTSYNGTSAPYLAQPE